LLRLAVDSASDVTRAWALPVELAGEVTPGDVVTVTARRFTHRAVTLRVDTVRHGPAGPCRRRPPR
jgi:hypothetical protein